VVLRSGAPGASYVLSHAWYPLEQVLQLSPECIEDLGRAARQGT